MSRKRFGDDHDKLVHGVFKEVIHGAGECGSTSTSSQLPRARARNWIQTLWTNAPGLNSGAPYTPSVNIILALDSHPMQLKGAIGG
mgnify:CR=1 FL=1